MKQLIVSLVILSLYGLADVALTTIGLDLGGLHEVNPFVPVDHLFLHWVAVTMFVVIDALAICAIGKRFLALDLKRAVQGAVSLITVFYIYVLVNNTMMIWRV